MRAFFLMITLLMFAGCEPGYNCYVQNTSMSDMYVKTLPSIESLYDKRSVYYDSISKFRIGEDSGLSVYRISANSQLRLYGHVGLSPSLKEMPFDHIEVIAWGDTVVLNSKESILSRLVQDRRTRSYFLRF